MERFPMLPSTLYWYNRGFAPPRHMGIDIFAKIHEPLVAVEPGLAWSATEPKGGKVVYLLGASGARYFYGHLESWAGPGMITATAAEPMRVEAGWDVGYVGTTGNAAGGPSHCHFQIRRGDTVVDPYPELYAVDPNSGGEPLAPDAWEQFKKEAGSFAGDLSSGLGMIALVWFLLNASRK